MIKADARFPPGRSSEAKPRIRSVRAGGRPARVLVFVVASILIVGTLRESRGAGPRAKEIGRGSPHVSLDRVIDSGNLATKKSKLLRWIVDQEADSLLQRPFAVAWDEDSLLVTDPGTGRVLRIDPRDRVKLSSTDALVTPMGIARCTAGILVTDSSTGDLLAFDSDLRLMGTVASGLNRPTGVACHDGRVIVVETGRHRLVVLEDRFQDSAIWIDDESECWGRRGGGNGEWNFPTAVAADGNRLWVGDTLNFRVQQLASSGGEFVTAFGQNGDAPGEMPRIKGLAVDSVGNLWVSDAHLDQVALYRSDGAFLTSVGGSGGQPGEFSFPAGVAAHEDGRVAVVDSLNRRIQVFSVSSPGKDGLDR
jgi:DNA-binding beta-propeller fold protein YncE